MINLTFSYMAGYWTPVSKKQVFAGRQSFTEAVNTNNLRTYREVQYKLSDGRSLGMYVRPDFKDNRNPPILVIVGGLGFGGPVAANSWRPYLTNWNPILVDTRGAGNSAPLADPAAVDSNTILEDLEGIVAATGLKEIPILGYSFAGTLGLMLADRLTDAGMTVPFVGTMSPTMCDTDRDWCFDFNKIGQSFPDDAKADAWRRWEQLCALLPSGTDAAPGEVLNVYTRMLRNPDPAVSLDAFVRMRMWEDAPYRHLDDSFTAASVAGTLQAWLKRGLCVEDYMKAVTTSRGGLDDYFNDPDMVRDEEDRKQLRAARTLGRYIANMIVWTESWEANCGLGPEGMLPTLKTLRQKGLPALITQNSGDALVPAGQAARWQSAWPEAVQIIETQGHGVNSEVTREALFTWLEERRLAVCGPEATQERLARLQAEDSFKRDLGDAVKANKTVDAAVAVLSRGDAREAARILPFAHEKKRWLDSKQFAIA